MSITAAFYNYFTTYFYKQCRFPPFNETLNGPRNQNTERENEAPACDREGLWVKKLNSERLTVRLVNCKAYGSSIFVFSLGYASQTQFKQGFFICDAKILH